MLLPQSQQDLVEVDIDSSRAPQDQASHRIYDGIDHPIYGFLKMPVRLSPLMR